jgi:peroxiredoxin
MPSQGDSAPDFTAKVANGDVEEFTLSEHLREAPAVLAFFPGAFTPPCSNEMNALQSRIDEFDDAGATLYGVSADSAFSLNAFRDEYDLEFDLVSDMNRAVIEDYDLSIDVADLGLYGVANRAVYVLDEDGEITYAWTAESPENEPDYEELLEAVRAA